MGEFYGRRREQAIRFMENGIYFPGASFAEVYYYLGEKEKALRSLE